ncbi:Vacuolar calcium ion transporter (High copy number undoes manganese protein 1) (Manganese resistance 1 protein) (Vacuolar Ca(2+)/H(+) exchanger) [Durusdinium trenchii]|uniref:Vacuolar calcium ion transporter (High copy number undoes manganese protein 1) (Manganese resistance 1 protein) (Vacuolar Ca(2+)/H(+) exchanger) n=1 Tax=Durusdinium trenchii TaxID=1381693 RepID=A0ABP0HE81_9DINO
MASAMQAQKELRRTNSKLGRQEYQPVPTSMNGDEAKTPKSDLEGFATIFGDNKILTALLVFVPIGLVAHQLEMNPTYVFTFNFLAIIPLAWLIGKSTEDVAARIGETAGGLLNATFGNVVEMLLCIAGIRNNEIGVVQCTLLGSILSNLLLVMGCAFLFGGLYFPIQTYNQAGAATQCSLMALSVFAIGLPTIYVNVLKQESEWEHMVEVSRWASVCLLGVYFAYLVFQLKTHASLFQDSSGGEEEEEEEPDLSPVTAAIMLCICTVVTSFATDALIEAIKGTISEWKVSKEFIGIILLPIIGNAAEHYTAIKVAMQNKMDLSLGVAAGSSCQMALLVTPFTVLVGWCYGTEMTLNFHAFQLAVLLFSVFLVNTILNNGQSNWLEGYILLVTYFVVSLIYFFEGTEENTSLASID